MYLHLLQAEKKIVKSVQKQNEWFMVTVCHKIIPASAKCGCDAPFSYLPHLEMNLLRQFRIVPMCLNNVPVISFCQIALRIINIELIPKYFMCLA